MSSHLRRLARLLPPPSTPIETMPDGVERFDMKRHAFVRLASWADAERVLGTKIPDDYKAFIGTYGSGEVEEVLRVMNPFSHMAGVDLIYRSQEVAELFGPQGRSFFPRPAGLLVMASTSNGDFLAWRTGGDPNSWPIVLLEARSNHAPTFDKPLTAFIASMLEERTVNGLFGEGFPDEPAVFRPWNASRTSHTFQVVFAEDTPGLEFEEVRLHAIATALEGAKRRPTTPFFHLPPGDERSDAVDLHYREDVFFSDIEQRNLHRGSIQVTFSPNDEAHAKHMTARCIRAVAGKIRRRFEEEPWPDLEQLTYQ